MRNFIPSKSGSGFGIFYCYFRNSFFLFAVLFFSNCAPQPVSQSSEDESANGVEKEEELVGEGNPLDPCPTFSTASRGDEALTAFVLSRDFLKSEDYDEAFKHWKKAYEIAPAADGQRWTIFSDGIQLYEHFLEDEEDPNLREEYILTILRLYEEIGICYPDQEAYSAGRKAFDLYYKYSEYAEPIEIFELFREAVEYYNRDEVPAFVINPYTDLLVKLVKNEEIEVEVARDYATAILEIIELNADPEDPSWNIVGNYTPGRLMDLESIENFFSCDYYHDTYFHLYLENPEDCETIQLALGKLQWGNCPEDMEAIVELRGAIEEHCALPVTATSLVREAYEALRAGRFREAISKFSDAIQEEEDRAKKADYALIIGKIYYSHLRDFPRARDFAERASSLRPNWGAPHILIGKLYASSGPLCGPGTGWDSQVVTWVAIDEWEKAKRLDSSVASEANQLISSYNKYMPTREDLHQRLISPGDSYFVPCWIQRSTTVRAVK